MRALLVVAFSLLVQVQAADPHLEIIPKQALYDTPVSIRVSGLPPGRQIKLRASAVDGAGENWESSAIFSTGAHGLLDVASAESLGGSYTGVDALGLLWSMEPKPARKGAEFSTKSNITIRVEAELEGKIVARAIIERITPSDQGKVRKEEIREGGLVGDLYLPSAKGHHAAVIVLSGSDGAPMPARAALLAARGYVVFDLSYFGRKSLPEELIKVPLEYFEQAVSWLKKHQAVDPNRIGVIGFSRGAEAALLLASLSADIKAVVAIAPSAVIWPGPGASGYGHSAWSYGGKEWPYAPVKFSKGLGLFMKELTGARQIEHRPLFEQALTNTNALRKATIPVQKIRGAVLSISGKDDRVWPSTPMAEMIMTSLREHNSSVKYRHSP